MAVGSPDGATSPTCCGANFPTFVGVSVLCPGMVETNLATSPRGRQERFGGPSDDNRRLSLEGGMDPEAVGELAVVGVRRGDFVIMTHGSVREIADQRARDVVVAFDALP